MTHRTYPTSATEGNTDVTRFRAVNVAETLRYQGRSISWLARQCDIGRVHTSRIVNGSHHATPDRAERIAKALDVPVAILFSCE